MNNNHSRGVVYTAIIGDYDSLKTPQIQSKALDYVCFSDSPIEHPCWQHRPIPQQIATLYSADPTRQARYLKLHPHELFPKHTWSIWVDGSLNIVGDLSELLTEIQQAQQQFGVYSHAKRDCLFQAAENCINKKKDDPEVIQHQMQTYQSAGFPEHFGLVASGVLVRAHNIASIKQFNIDWWSEIKRHSRRDQLSFNYVCWKTGFQYYSIPERIGDGRYFRRGAHKKTD